MFPTNNYAYFEVNTEASFYTNERYQILPGTGNVISSNESYTNLTELPAFNYPLNRYAYQLCTSVDNKNLCSVTQTIGISTYYRVKSTDKFRNAVNKTAFTCYIEVDQPEVERCNMDDASCAEYRSADPGNLFPGGVIAENWDNEEGRKAIEYIESNASKLVGNNTDLLEYTITMNPQQLQAIRQ